MIYEIIMVIMSLMAKKSKSNVEDVPDDHKLIEFDVDTTNPRKLKLEIICQKHDLTEEDFIDGLQFVLDKLLGYDKGLN